MSDQFNCKNCNESLGGRKYIQVEDKPHCIPCYDRLYANTCQECKEIIGHNAKVSSTQKYFGLERELKILKSQCMVTPHSHVRPLL